MFTNEYETLDDDNRNISSDDLQTEQNRLKNHTNNVSMVAYMKLHT